MSSLSVHFGTGLRHACHKQRVNDCMGPHNVGCSYVDEICSGNEVVTARICLVNESNGAVSCAELTDHSAQELLSSYIAGALFRTIFGGKPLDLRPNLKLVEKMDKPDKSMQLCLSSTCTEDESVSLPPFVMHEVQRISGELYIREELIPKWIPCTP